MYDFTRGANGEDIQLQFVDDHGAHVMQHPINLEALLQMDGQRMPLDHGISLTAEEYRSDDDYDDAEEMEENSGITGRQYPDTLKDDAAFIQAPPGTQATGWHDVLNALQHEAAAARTGGGEAAPRRGGGGGGAQSTQLTLLHYPNERPPKSLPAHNIQNNANTLSSLSRQELWASFAPPAVAEVDYGRMHYRTILDEHNPRLFRPCALSFHATTSYTSAVDKSQRVVMYGGLTRGSFETIHPEMYEFTLLNGSWRRVEGRRCSPAGHYAHTLTAVSAMDRLVVVGGIGPGGMLPDGWQRAMQDDHLCEARVALLMPFINTRQEVKPARLHGIGQTLAPSSANVGFVPFAFDMSLADQTWRAITTSTPITCCFHSAVAYGKGVLLFGGVNEYLQPTDELRVLDVESYNLRTLCFNVVTSSNARPCARYLHSAVRFGQYMIIYGGFDAQNEPLEDCWAFDIINERWEKLTCNGSAGPRAGHSACVVGARMMIVGGVASTLRHDAIKEDGFLSTIAQLNLVPTAGGEYVWRHAKLKHPLPPMAFGGAAPCGDDLSILMCGGLTTAKLRGSRGARAAHPARARSRSTGPHSHSRSTSPATQPPPPHHDADDVVHPLANTYHTIDDSLLVTYAAAKRTAASTTTAGASDEDDEHRDPNALPPNFSAFLRRQEDFLKKKNAAVDIIMTKATLAEREGMEPALYLKEDEIERLIQMSERCCTTFSEAYKVENLPSHVPDRDARVHILENCISLTRQARDILKSMKASVVGLSAVKSKTHRAGTKFEDYAAAKPFRRIAVAHLLSGVATELEAMHELNKSLKNSLWEEKQLFMDAIATMGKGLHQLNSSIAHVMAKYIGNRVTSLMKGVEKHKEVMQRLTEVVERNRHDKIFASNAGPDKQRERVKKEWAKGDAGGAAAAPLRRATSKHAASSSRQHQSMGAGYFRDEADARIIITDAWVKDTRASADRIDALAETLLQHLEAGKGALLPTTPGVAPLSTASNATTTATSIFAAPPSLQPLPLPLPLGMPTQDAHALAPPPTAAANNTTAPAPRDAVIQRSNDLRDKTASVVADVRQAVRQFVQEVVEPPPPPPPQPTVSVAELIAPPVADASALPAPPSALLPPPNLLAAANIIAAAAAPPPPAPTVAAPPTHDATPTPRHLALASLRPLLAQKDRLHKAATKTPLIRLNQWDGNDLAGAPQDERAELLTRKLYSRLAGLVQLLSASFLSKAGAKAPRAKPTSQSIQAPPPAKTRVRGASAKVRHASSSSSSPSPPRRHTTTVEPNYSDSSFESAEEEEVGTSSGALTAISPELRRYAAPFTLAAPTTTTDVPASTSSAAAAPATVAVLSDAQKALMALSDGVVPSSITSVVVLPNNTSATSLSISAPAAAGACIYSFGHQPAATAASSSSCTAATAGGALHASAADIAVSTGVVVHREPTPPPAVVAPPPTTAAAAVAATTALPQDPATSISPGPFVVNSEYFAQAFPTRTSVAHVVGAAADEPSPHRWAEAEEDYFYFGRLPRNTDGQPSTALAYPSCVVAPARSVRVLPRTAPPVGSEVGSLHVNAHLVSASNRSGVRGARYATSARPSASTTTAAAMLASGTRGRMTLGEQRIAEARKRHETR